MSVVVGVTAGCSKCGGWDATSGRECPHGCGLRVQASGYIAPHRNAPGGLETNPKP